MTYTAGTVAQSYASGWDLAHSRLAAADAVRSEYLSQRWRATKPEPITRVEEAPRPRCVICGGPKASRAGTRCLKCGNWNLCHCGKKKHRYMRLCPQCWREGNP